MGAPWEKYQHGGRQQQTGPWQKYGSTPPADGGVMGFVNKGIATTLGAPVDLVNAGLDMVGLGSEMPIGGADSIRAAMRAISIETPDRSPETLGEYIGAGVGEAAGALIPAGAVARGASAATGVVGRTAREVAETAARRPVAAIATELTAGAGAGVGRGVGEANFESPAARTAAELAGGIVGGFGPGAAVTALSRSPIIGTGYRMVKGAIVPFTEGGAKVRASNRLRDVAEKTPEELAAALAEPNEFGLDPATMTGDEGLIALRRSVLDENPKMRRDSRDLQQQSEGDMRQAIEEVGGGGDIEATREFLIRERQAATRALEERMTAAQARVQQRVAGLTPERARSESSAILREELDAAMKEARAQERRLWEMVPDDVTVPTVTARQRYEALVGDLPRAQRDAVPAAARQFLERGGNDAFGDVETVKEMRGLRSRLLDDARKARAAGEYNEARIADDLADAILDDLAASGDETLTEARRFSAMVNQTFRQGGLGRVLGYAREGGGKVPAELTLQSTVGRGGETGAAQARDLVGAFEGAIPSPRAPAARAAITDYLKSQFADAAIRNGRLDLAAARRFVTANDETLRQFPELRKTMLSARSAQAVADIATTAAKGQTATPATDPVSRFLGAPVDQEIAALAKARSPTQAARALRTRAAADGTGEALRGLQSAMADHLLRGATRNNVLSADALVKILDDPKTGAVARTVMDGGQIQRLRIVAGHLRKLEAARDGTASAGPVMNDAPNRIIDMIGRTLGARWGAQAGQGTSGASLLTANFASQNVRRLLTRLTNDRAAELVRDAVVKDPELLRALLLDVSNPMAAATVNRKLNAWLIGPALPEEDSRE